MEKRVAEAIHIPYNIEAVGENIKWGRGDGDCGEENQDKKKHPVVGNLIHYSEVYICQKQIIFAPPPFSKMIFPPPGTVKISPFPPFSTSSPFLLNKSSYYFPNQPKSHIFKLYTPYFISKPTCL